MLGVGAAGKDKVEGFLAIAHDMNGIRDVMFAEGAEGEGPRSWPVRVLLGETGAEPEAVNATTDALAEPSRHPGAFHRSYRLLAFINSDDAVVERNAQNNTSITDPLAVQA